MSAPRIVILGAAGLIGFALAQDLKARGHDVKAVARRFTRAQSRYLGESAFLAQPVSMPQEDLTKLVNDADIVVNCIGVLQDGPSMNSDTVHRQFADSR